ncbi:MAG: DsrE family protein [Leptospirales bacterium]
MKLGILVSTRPDQGDVEHVRPIVEEALARKDKVYLYLLDDGTLYLRDDWVHNLVDQGVHVYSCAYGAQNRKIYDSGKTTFCGLVVLTQLMEGCDRFLSFN